ncbi:MAG: MucB/RseB C-terminal domain-containing protein [Aquabacterium sp.]
MMSSLSFPWLWRLRKALVWLWLPAAGATVAADAQEPYQMLQRIQLAAQRVSYQGTVVHAAAGQVSSLRVVQVCEGNQRYEQTEALDGRPRQQYRHNERVHTLWPQARVAVVERDDAAPQFPALPSSGDQLRRNYEVQRLAAQRVAGHLADGLRMVPRDSLRFAQRLWVDRNSGLLLRSEVLDTQGKVLESSAFSDLNIGAGTTPQAILAAMRRLDGYRVVQPAVERTQLDAEGWLMASDVAGFRQVGCSRRPLDPTGPAGSRSPTVVQSVFSDGLTQVSLFIEPLDPARHKQPMRTVLGATHALMQRHGTSWITVMGDVPMATLEQFASALQSRR